MRFKLYSQYKLPKQKQIASNVVVNLKTRPSVRYLMREEKQRVCKLLLGSKAKPSPPKQSVAIKCQIWSENTKKKMVKSA